MMKKRLIHVVLSSFLLFSGVSVVQAQQLNKKNKPFLIQGKMPHYTMMVKKLWDNEKFGLSPMQKEKLLKIRKITLSEVKRLAKEIMPLEKEIAQAAKQGKDPKTLQKKVQKVAQLRAEATMVHLNCIYQTQQVLTPQQLKMLKKH